MRILIVFIFLIITVGCSKEPSLLDRCVATNSEKVNYYDKFDTHIEKIIRFEKIFEEELASGEEGFEEVLKRQLWYNSFNDIEKEINKTRRDIAKTRDKTTDTKEWNLNVAKQLQVEAVESIKAKAIKKCASLGIY